MLFPRPDAEMKYLGFSKKENQIEAYGAMLKFLDQYLKEKGEIKG